MNAKKANNTIGKARQLQRKLYLAAKENSKRRFHALYDKVARKDILKTAWERVKANQGAAGIDKVTIEEIEAIGIETIIKEIQNKLLKNKYNPLPVKRVYIPKKDGGERPLGIPAVTDRIIQMATKIVIEPIFEADFKECSYGFRPKRNAHQALDKIKTQINNKGWFVLDADITKYFDTISHDKLITLIELRISDRRIIKLIKKWLKSGVMEAGKYIESPTGAPQGGVISPLLSNIYLNYFDTLWEKNFKEIGNLYRYADDFVIISRTRERINKALKAVKEIMKRLELTLHPTKTRIVNMWNGKEGFDFLGFHHRSIPVIMNGKRSYHSLHQWPSNKAQRSMIDKTRNVLGTPQAIGQSMKELIKTLNRKIIGWRNYYGLPKARKALNKIDDYIIKRFVIWSNRKAQAKQRLGHMTKIRRILRANGLERVTCY